MGLTYNVSKKELLVIRKKIFMEEGLPKLEKQGFKRSPFSTSWFGWNAGINCYIFEIGRLLNNSILENLNVYINRDDRWIQIYLNIFKLSPAVENIEQLKELNGINFGIPPNSLTKMRLREDGNKGIVLINELFSPHYKLGISFSSNGFQREVEKLKNLISSDMQNIGFFIEKWHSIYQVSVTDWNGNRK
ncbi:hypothetical protein [Sphingobacterium sp. UBA7038]|jgi:hypothetical protein|uniref:hypothetical protein n=2 Tax=Sphingobacterium TaxID=28453 RepID=UPI00257E7D67|nr:hypothetical protein [Sphingobacterium sp. UBA7038]